MGICEDYYGYIIDMYASDITHKKRAETVYRNLQLQKEWFTSGGTIRILGQKGGNDYSYMKDIQEGCIIDKCWQVLVPISGKSGNAQVVEETTNMRRVALIDIFDFGYSKNPNTENVILDDSVIPIDMGGQDFYFFGTNYGAANDVYWNTNNAITFGQSYSVNLSNLSATTVPAILLGQFDRLTSKFYTSNYLAGSNKYTVTKIIVYFSNYYTDTTDFDKGKMQVRLIRELVGVKRQWVEVSIISSVDRPGYSNNPRITYPSGVDPVTRLPRDSDSLPIDPTKNSPWDITDGSGFLNIAGNAFSTAFPAAGTSLLYQSNATGSIWTFSQNAYLDV